MLQQLIDAFTSTEAAPAWLTVLGPSLIAVAGVILAQVVVLRNERSRQRLEHSKVARDNAEELRDCLFNYMYFVNVTVVGNPEKQIELLDLEWDKVNVDVGRRAELIPSKSHRQALRPILKVRNLNEEMIPNGFGVSRTIHGDFRLPAEAAHDIVAAWLRHEPVPRHARRVARRANRAYGGYRKFLIEIHTKNGNGFISRRWRKARLWVVVRINIARSGVRRFWRFLFA